MKLITERELAMLLGGEAVSSVAGKEVYCKSIKVGTCSEEGFLESFVCQQSRHNVDRMEEQTASWKPAVREYYLSLMEEGQCPLCKGAGVIKTKSREGRLIAMSSLIFCRFAGVELPREICNQLLRGAA